MGASGGRSSRGPRLGLLLAIAALFALIPAARASAASFTLTVNVVGEGYVECKAEFEVGEEVEVIGPEECEKEQKIPENAEVTLTAVELGDEFLKWEGDCAGEPEECEFEMDGPHEVTAVFGPEPVAKHKLKVNVVGSGKVECELEEGPEPCLTEYPEEGEFGLTEVTLVPVADAGSEFLKWEGDCAGEPEECELEMDEDHEVTAVFGSEEGEEGEEEGGGGGGSSSDPPLAPFFPPAGPGKARVSGAGLYRGGRATLRLICKGGGSCKGTVKLIAKLKVGKKKRKKVTVGKAAFSLPAGGSRVLRVKLSRRAKRLLGRGRTLSAKVRGRGVIASKVKIKPSAR